MDNKISKNKVRDIIGHGFDDEGLITLNIDDINNLAKAKEEEMKKKSFSVKAFVKIGEQAKEISQLKKEIKLISNLAEKKNWKLSEKLKEEVKQQTLKKVEEMVDKWWVKHFPPTGDEPLRELKQKLKEKNDTMHNVR